MADRVLVLSNRPGSVKSIHTIDLGHDDGDEVSLRRSPKFNEYFDNIWHALDIQIAAMT